MTKKKDEETSVMNGTTRLYNGASRESIIIADEEMVNYDVRLWQIVKG